jgi:hypothetical protein
LLNSPRSAASFKATRTRICYCQLKTLRNALCTTELERRWVDVDLECPSTCQNEQGHFACIVLWLYSATRDNSTRDSSRRTILGSSHDSSKEVGDEFNVYSIPPDLSISSKDSDT